MSPPPRSQIKPYKTWARDLTACSCYKKPFFGKIIKKKSTNPSSMPSPLLGDFSGKRSGPGLPWQQMRACLSKEGTLIFFSLSHSLFQLCVCTLRMPVPAEFFFFRTKESPSLPSVPQIWSDGKPLTPAGQGRFRMVQEKRERSYGAPFLHLLARDCMQQRPSQMVGVPRAGKKGKVLSGEAIKA